MYTFYVWENVDDFKLDANIFTGFLNNRLIVLSDPFSKTSCCANFVIDIHGLIGTRFRIFDCLVSVLDFRTVSVYWFYFLRLMIDLYYRVIDRNMF